MCVVSFVHDYYEDKIPKIEPYTPYVPPTTGDGIVWPPKLTFSPPALDLRELNALIHEFKRLLENAREIDDKTGQPDCVDPEKAKLQDRIAELEKLIAQPPEIVIVQGGKVEPGKYRVIDGRLYRLVE